MLLGLIYVASVFLYLHVKKRKSRHSENNSSANTTMKNDQVTFGPGYKRNDSITGFGTNRSGLDNDRASGRKSNGHRGMPDSINGEEIGIVKNNPLLRHYPSLSDNSGFTSDLSNSNSECDDDRMIDANFIKNVSVTTDEYVLNGYKLMRKYLDALVGHDSPIERCKVRRRRFCFESRSRNRVFARRKCVDSRRSYI